MCRSYLQQRQIDLAIAEELGLGYFPIKFQQLFKVTDPKKLRDSGIVIDAKRSKFSGRLIFPIADWEGNIVAIAGRKVSDKVQGPKYYNSLYLKAKHLYNLDRAIPFMEQSEDVYVVEGQMDVVRMWDHNLRNVVAVCGSSLTPHQVMLLARYCNKIKLVFDNDEAGRLAASNTLHRYDLMGLAFQTIPLPSEYKDVDELGIKEDLACLETIQL